MYAKMLRPAASLLALMTLLLGVAYPLLITGVARLVFPQQAAGSLVYKDNKLVGSSLIGQSFNDPRYFWGRLSATATPPYNGVASGGSNLGPLNPALIDRVKASVKTLRDADPGNLAALPVDLVTASASGLDPDITPAAAHYQAARVARARGLPVAKVAALIEKQRQGKLFELVGESRVNVLELNLALDAANR
jgi:K+-transporting ATPase ATPase C chain